MLELQEDAQKPNPYPTFDMASRHQLAMLRIKNAGWTAAHDVSLEWDIELINQRGKKIGFFKKGDSPGIAVLLPGESISQIIAVHHKFIEQHPNFDYTGTVVFQDPLGREYRKAFRLDGRQYAEAPTYDEEAPRTHHELQRIPQELKQIREVLKRHVG